LNYLAPLQGIAEGLQWKAWASLALTFALELLSRLFSVNIDLVALISLLVLADFITGTIAARRRGEPITSRKRRRSFIKAIEYAAFLGLTTALANVVSAGEIPLVSEGFTYLDELAYVLVALTEWGSICENTIGGTPAGRRIAAALRKLITDKAGLPDELLDHEGDLRVGDRRVGENPPDEPTSG